MKQNTYLPIQQVRDVQPIRATCFHPSGEAFVVGTNSKSLKICKYPGSDKRLELIDDDGELEEPEISFTCLSIHCASVYCASFNSAGNLLATGSNDQIVHVIKYNSARHAPIGSEYKLSMHKGTIRDVCFMHDNMPESASSRLLSAGAGDFSIHLTDCNVMKLTQSFKGHSSTVMSLDCSKESSDLFVSGSLDGTTRLWDIRCKNAISTITRRIQQQQQQHSQQEKALPQLPTTTTDGDTSFSAPNSTRLILSTNKIQCQENQENKRTATETKEPRRLPPLPTEANANSSGEPIGVVRLDSSGRLLASGHHDGSCMLYDIRAGKIIQLFQAHEDEIRAMSFSPNCYYLLTGAYDRRVKLTDLQGQLRLPLPSVEVVELDDKVVQVAWHPRDYNFVSTCADGSATLWAVPDFDNWRDSLAMEESIII